MSGPVLAPQVSRVARRAASMLALTLAGCAASPYSRGGGGVGPLAAHQVDWNPGHQRIVGVRAVADAGSDVVAFADGAATVLSGGRVVAVDSSVPAWVSAGTLPAADGSGTWIVGVDGEGQVRRLLGKKALEPVSDRFGLTGARVAEVATIGPGFAAFRLQDQIAVADGAHVTRYATGPLVELVGGGGRAAFESPAGTALSKSSGGDRLRVLDVASKGVSGYTAPTGRTAFVAMNTRGRLFVASTDAIWAEDLHGDLRLRFATSGSGGALHGLVASGDRVWFADGTELGLIEGDRVRETSGAGIDRAATLVGSPSGDVWTLTAGTLARWAAPSEHGPDWTATIAPVFHRACETCHRVGGEAGVSLATQADWERRGERIRRRVFVDGDMPPPDHPLSERDRAAIRAWLDR
jgi:hypothetical protein